MFQRELFGHKINLRSEHCSKNKEVPAKIDQPYINLYVQMTKACNATCKFCAFKDQHQEFDFEKLQLILRYIDIDIKINKVSFTGGEPTTQWDKLLDCLIYTKTLDDTIFTVVNTNGLRLDKLNKYQEYIDSIALSRHHYNDTVNNEILGFKAPSTEYINSLKHKDKIHLSCNLIKDYIDNTEEVINYLEFASQIGVLDVGFVSLMKVNDYCKEHHIDFNSLDFKDYKNIFINREWNNKEMCRCRNYLYASTTTDEIVKVYSRYYADRNNCESQLVYDGQYLRDGFNRRIIL